MAKKLGGQSISRRGTATRTQRALAPGAPDVAEIVASFERAGAKRIREDMAKRYGITGKTAETAFGVSVGVIRDTGKRLTKELGGKDAGAARHELARQLWNWDGGQYEARMLAAFVDDPIQVTASQMDAWAKDFDNWGICDTVCFHLFDKVPLDLAFKKVHQWSRRKEEFVKRASFALLASLALHLRPRDAEAERFIASMPLFEAAACDDRNFVKKGVNWALRGVGGRTPQLRSAAIEVAQRLAKADAPSARWIGRDAFRALSTKA